MTVLNCENLDTALCSIAAVYDAREDSLVEYFRELDLDEHYRKNRPELSGEEELQRLLELCFGPVRFPISRTFWFHLTRTHPDEGFERGILPLGDVLPSLWARMIETLSGTAHAERLQLMAREGVRNFQFNLKVPERMHWGPFAMLVKEIGWHSEAAMNHNYLRLPEIVEDICDGYQDRFGEDIQPFFESSWQPTVVKFWTDEATHLYGLSSAIYYVYLALNGLELSGGANTCFDGEGTAIPSQAIVYVERVDA